MTEEELKDYIDHAHATGRNLTSDLADDIIKKMDSHIKLSIEENVVTKLSELSDDFRTHRESDTKWKERFTPALETLEKTGHWASTTGLLMNIAIKIGGLVGLIYTAIHFFKDK